MSIVIDKMHGVNERLVKYLLVERVQEHDEGPDDCVGGAEWLNVRQVAHFHQFQNYALHDTCGQVVADLSINTQIRVKPDQSHGANDAGNKRVNWPSFTRKLSEQALYGLVCEGEDCQYGAVANSHSHSPY